MPITDDDFERIISDKDQRINTFQPIVKDNNIKMFTVIPSVMGSNVYELSLSERSIYLYELRTLIDSLSIIEKHSDNSFFVELTLSKSTVLNGLFIKFLLSKVYSTHVISRIVLNIFDDFCSTSEKEKVINQLNDFKKIGYQVMFTSSKKGISYMFLCSPVGFLKVNLSSCSTKMKKIFISFFFRPRKGNHFCFFWH